MARALTAQDVVPYLSRLWTTLADKPDYYKLKIGLCVSGGPDSMALTYLIQQAVKEKAPGRISIEAFIVDHKLRPESTKEANTVSQWLRDIGVSKTKILDVESFSLKRSGIVVNMETSARHARYESLAMSVANSRLKFLLLGHHQDDQVETILMRLVRDLTGSLKSCNGMDIESPIPTGEKIAGAHEEGVLNSREAKKIEDLWPDVEDPGQMYSLFSLKGSRNASVDRLSALKVASNPVRVCAEGGVRLLRPLLSFSKASLIATCRANAIPYVVDQTNLNPQHTQRNAVRYLREHYRLPRALGTNSLLTLHERALLRRQHISERGAQLARMAKLVHLDLRSGTARFHMPQKLIESLADCSESSADAISRLLYTVNARLKSEVPSRISEIAMADIVGLAMDAPKSTCRGHVASRTVCETLISTYTDYSQDGEKMVFWHLSREPFPEAKKHLATMKLTWDKRINVFKRHRLSESRGEGMDAFHLANPRSYYVFWDFRYWIRVHTPKGEDISRFAIRPFQEGDTKYGSDLFSALHNKAKESRWSNFLEATRGSKARYTIPTLTYDEQPCALPTFCLRFPGRQTLFTWDVVYKELRKDYGLSSSWHRLSRGKKT